MLFTPLAAYTSDWWYETARGSEQLFTARTTLIRLDNNIYTYYPCESEKIFTTCTTRFTPPSCVDNNIYTYKGQYESLCVINTRLLTYIYPPLLLPHKSAIQSLIIYNNNYPCPHIHARNKFSEQRTLNTQKRHTQFIDRSLMKDFYSYITQTYRCPTTSSFHQSAKTNIIYQVKLQQESARQVCYNSRTSPLTIRRSLSTTN